MYNKRSHDEHRIIKSDEIMKIVDCDSLKILELDFLKSEPLPFSIDQ